MSTDDVEAAIRAGCSAAEVHLMCSFPSCSCKDIPTAIKAAIAALKERGWKAPETKSEGV